MAHALQDRYSALVAAKLRNVLVTKDGIIFNNNYEGDPKAGAVKIPTRSSEVAAAAYNKATGMSLNSGTTTYTNFPINKDIAVNELIDGYDAAAVPDGIVAERLDSAAYSLALTLEGDAITELEGNATQVGTTAALTVGTAYKNIVDARTAMSKAGVPVTNRWLLVSPDTYALLLQDTTNFIRSTQLGDDAVSNGMVGKIAGFAVYECAGLDSKTDFIAGHPDYCCRVNEWAVPVHIQDLNGSGTFIGASAVQGRQVYGHKVTSATALRIHKNA